MPRKAKRTAETEREPFPTILRQELEERDIAQVMLAKVLGVARQTVSLYCTGQSAPDSNVLNKMADYLNVSVDYLLGRTKTKTTNATWRAVCDYTGLSENAVRNLAKEGVFFSGWRNYQDIVSRILESENFFFFVTSVISYIVAQKNVQNLHEQTKGKLVKPTTKETLIKNGVISAGDFMRSAPKGVDHEIKLQEFLCEKYMRDIISEIVDAEKNTPSDVIFQWKITEEEEGEIEKKFVIDDMLKGWGK